MTLVAQQPVCASCDSPDIDAYALVSWSREIQDWQISDVADRCTCGNCGNSEAKIKWENRPAA